MDVCPTTILRKFEESEDDQSIDDRFKKSPASAKKSGYQTLPDGGEWSAEDDSDTPPQSARKMMSGARYWAQRTNRSH